MCDGNEKVFARSGVLIRVINFANAFPSLGPGCIAGSEENVSSANILHAMVITCRNGKSCRSWDHLSPRRATYTPFLASSLTLQSISVNNTFRRNFNL